MTSRRYKYCFKIKAASNTRDDIIGVTDIHNDVKRFMDIHGGCIKLDANLKPGEYWYYTDVEKSALEKSILVELINETLT